MSNYWKKGDGWEQCFSLKTQNKRVFDVNLTTKRFYDEETKQWITLKVSTRGIKTISKKGLQAALRDARKKGFIN